MRYQDFEKIMSSYRMSRYLAACGGNTKQAMTLYRLNLRLSQEMFTAISCFEVALRNAIDNHYRTILGAEWLKNAASRGGIFDNRACRLTQAAINEVIQSLGTRYSHGKVVAGLGFGVWRYLFAPNQFAVTGEPFYRFSLQNPAVRRLFNTTNLLFLTNCSNSTKYVTESPITNRSVFCPGNP